MRKFLLLLAIFMGFSFLAFSQTETITGTVLDEAANPVPFASITLKGSTTGVSADADGRFIIKASQGAILVVSATGYNSVEVTATGSTLTPVLQKGDGVLIEEVVVTALGVKRADRSLGYSVSKLDPSAVLQKSEPDLLKSMQGKVPGVDIRSSQGTPGAGTRIQIRGNSSFGLESQPLIVVDGVPYNNDQVTTSSQTSGGGAYGSGIANLDQNDIESMNILKGAAAAALYGSRGSRGVIVITTKSGSAKKGAKPINVSLNTSYSLENIANLPTYQNMYGAGSNFLYQNSNGSWGPKFGTLDSIDAWPEYLAAYPELFSSTGKTPYKAYPDNVKELFQTGALAENSISVNGGDEQTTFALTVSNVAHKGYVENSSYSRNNVSVGGQTRFKKLSIGGNLSYMKSKQLGGFFGENQVDGAASQFARSLFLARNWDLSLPYEDANGKPLIPNGGAQFDNPHWAAYNNIVRSDEQRSILGVRLGYEFNDWINLTYNLGFNNYQVDRNERTQEFSRAANGLGRIVKDQYTSQELESTLMLILSPRINENFTLDAKVGNNINQRYLTRETNTGLDFIVPSIYTLKNTATQSFDNDSRSKRRIVGFFAEATVGYNNYAFLTITGRQDITSTLPYKNASYFYPSFAGSFVFSEALKIRSDVFSYGKLRLSWAKVGNDASPWNGEDVFSILTNFTGVPRASRGSLTIDPNLTPEFTQELEGGFDLSFLRKRINLDFTAYDKKSTNLIYGIAIPSSTGYSNLYTNIGEISNKGIEIGLSARIIETNDFSWDLRGVFTKNKNIVISLTEGLERTPQSGVLTEVAPYFEPGLPYGYIRGTKVERDEEGNFMINPSTGGLLVNPEQGMVGNPNPDYKLGISTGFNYKGIFLNGLFDYTRGGDIYSVTISSLLGRGVIEDTKDREAAFIIPGYYADPNTRELILDAEGNKIPNQTRISANDLFFSPNPTNGATFAINTATEMNIYDATVMRLRELVLGYEIPKSVYSKLPISKATISFSGRNLWYLAPNVPKSTRFDPEVSSFGASAVQGIELSAAPTTRRFGINLNVVF
ncbi:SusC/RagA family TonB-linked outer membrane protein [Niabella ginsengisoli]|uniref:SusC/RagA family TonB-linked outer membrane protein n=1 Tax=Niabella ginsengisoli TaxID=522298 RepID=A0ABS9SEA4_9BACT|nr:SusC/RagA family TonB-linked outer membrane protein [Niabella ginsengisoli]MCH5596681.1 SusC/RagA family TonB-linked outer membrane protein [Niabella ginsengisoli]